MDKNIQKHIPVIQEDPWSSLRSFTAARIALGRTGVSVPLRESLSFKLAHAHARDAVHASLNITALKEALQILHPQPVYTLHSKAAHRNEYLQRPDLGRQLDTSSVTLLQEINAEAADVAVIIADGLSATAVQQHALPLLNLLVPILLKTGLNLSPFTIIEQGRVGISDETAFLLHARLSLILIGERPGLSSADSLGAYLTYNPRMGLTDESRNCVSNIRPAGLSYPEAAQRLNQLIRQSLQLQLSGVMLKDSGEQQLLQP